MIHACPICQNLCNRRDMKLIYWRQHRFTRYRHLPFDSIHIRAVCKDCIASAQMKGREIL